MIDTSSERRGKIWILLAMLTGIFLLNFLARIILSPLLPSIEQDLGIGHGEAGRFFLYISIGYCLGLFGSGFLSSKFSHRSAITTSAMGIGIALLTIGISTSPIFIKTALVVMGLSAGVYLPSGMTMITTIIPRANWGKAIAAHELAPVVAYLAAPLLAESMLPWSSWRGVVSLVAIVSIATGCIFRFSGVQSGPVGLEPSFANIREVTGSLTFWLMAFLFSIAIGASIGIFSMLPLYLVAEHGFTRHSANVLIAFSRAGVIGSALIAGWLADRFGDQRLIKYALFFNGATIMLMGLGTGNVLTVSVFLQPILSVCFFPAGFALISGFSRPELRNLSVSLTVLIAYLTGAGFIPAVIGYWGEHNSFSAVIIAIGTVMTGSLFLVGKLKPGTEGISSAPPPKP
ncbi:MAG: MFS transporter [Deltaproteobacteria bacterium]|nr:MFS transporter [Deltaproteobacteria bacterium]